MGTMAPGWPWRWWARAFLSRFDSTSAEVAILRMFSTWPSPICWRGVGDLWVSFCHIGDKNRSIIVRKMAVEIRLMTRIDPAGIWKWGPRCRSIVKAWITIKLAWTPIGVPKNILDNHNGKILKMVLRSSTCCTVHIFQGFAIKPSDPISPSVLSAARLRNLHQECV